MKTQHSLITVISALFMIGSPALARDTQPTTDAHFKKITKAPVTDKAPEEHEAAPAAPAEEHGAAVKKPVVSSHPAPGSEKAKPAAEVEKKPEAAHAAKGHEAAASVDPDKSLHWLMNGNARFTGKKLRADGKSAADRERLVAGQHPHAIVLSCADSRVPPEIVFDQALGEIFTIRVAGEALDASVVASVEYAVEHLGPRLIVVMGHTKCGAVDTALKVAEGTSAGSADLDRLLGEIRPHLKSISTDKLSPNLEVESTVNADGVARDLVKRSEIVRKKVEAGELVIKPALYRLDSGKVTFY